LQGVPAVAAFLKILRRPKMINSGKYKIENNQIINIATGVAIPADEPVFILRARDCIAQLAIDEYRSLCENKEHDHSVGESQREFDQWQEANIDKVKEPD
jgi:hypothetical protein